jgi:hypothetical protein
MTLKEVSERLAMEGLNDRAWHVQPSCATRNEGLIDGLTWLTQSVEYTNK